MTTQDSTRKRKVKYRDFSEMPSEELRAFAIAWSELSRGSGRVTRKIARAALDRAAKATGS